MMQSSQVYFSVSRPSLPFLPFAQQQLHVHSIVHKKTSGNRHVMSCQSATERQLFFLDSFLQPFCVTSPAAAALSVRLAAPES